MIGMRWVVPTLAALGLAAVAMASAAPAAALPRAAGAAIEARTRLPEGPDQDAIQLGLTTGSAPGCVELPGAAMPTLGCTLVVGQVFQLPLAGWAFASDANTGLPLELSVDALPSGASFARLVAGEPVAGPIRDIGRVDARFDFKPAAEQITGPDTPNSLTFTAQTDGGFGSTQIGLQLVVLDGQPGTLVSGYVFDDRDGDGLWSEQEPPLAGRALQLDGPAPASLVSGADGRFAVMIDAPGSYKLQLLPLDGWMPTTPSDFPLEITGQGGATPLVMLGQRQTTGPALLGAEVGTDRGCLDLGAQASYAVGEIVEITLRVAGAPEASVQLSLIMPDGEPRLLVPRQRVQGGRWYGLLGTAGLPTGVRSLRLEAFRAESSSAQPDVVASCSYAVGAVAGPALQVEPERLSFPDTEPAASAELPLALHNVGSAPLTVASLAVQGGGASPFALDPQDAAGFVLPPGSSRAISVRFAPQWAGVFQDSLLVQSDDPSNRLLGVALQGQTPGSVGLAAQLRTDRGCAETGDSPIYFDGDPIQIRYGATGPSGNATVTLEDILPGGSVRTVLRRTIPIGTEALYESHVSPPIGTEQLRLTVESGGFSSQSTCTFQVGGSATRIVGWQFADLDGDGVWDGKPEPGSDPLPGAEPPVPGWTISLVGPETRTVVTDENGRFEFTVSQPGSYVVSEVQGPGWRPTTPTSVTVTIWGTPGEVIPEIRFGNQPTGTGATPSPQPTSPVPTSTPEDPGPSPTAGPSVTPAPTATGLPTAEPGADCVARDSWSRLPLGSSVTSLETPACIQVYVPTRHGGSLQLTAGAGQIWLYGPGVDAASGSPVISPARQLAYEVPRDAQGWYKVVLREAPGPGYNVQARFLQGGQSEHVPWNFWYFPFSPYAPGPKLYDQPGAYTKYDSRFGLAQGAWRYEVQEHRSTQAEGWWGHCWGACVASILLEQPRATAGFSQDELEGLAADFFDGFGSLALEWDWPHVKPSPSFGDQADLYADNFHERLREYLRDRRVALHMNLRQETGVGNPQVWNHAVYKYSSEMIEDPEAVGDPWTDKVRQIRIRTVITANEDFYAGGGSIGTPENGQRREQEAIYSLVYSSQGEVVPDASQPRPQNWRSMTLLSSARAGTALYIPSGISDVTVSASNWTGSSSPQGRNPYVDSQRLGALGLRSRY